MNYLRCTMCGGKLLPGEKEKTILICENCNNIVDLNQYLKVTVDIDNTSTNQKEKERLMKNVQLHINDNNFEYADKTLKELEFNYPGEQAITDLRDTYDKGLAAFIQKQKKLEQIRIRKQEIEELEQNIQTFILQNPTLFSSDSDEQQIDISDVSKACKLLSQANEYKIPAADLRSGMAKLHDNIINGSTIVTDTFQTYPFKSQSDKPEFYYSALLYALSDKRENENEIQDIYDDMDKNYNEEHRAYFSGFMFVCAGILFILILKLLDIHAGFILGFIIPFFLFATGLSIIGAGAKIKSDSKNDEPKCLARISDLTQLNELYSEILDAYYISFLDSTVNYTQD